MNVTSKTRTQGELMHAAEQAASQVGVRLYGLRPSGKGIAFTLKTGAKEELRLNWKGKEELQPKYQRLSQRTQRSTAKGTEGIEFNPKVPGAVCWHGHRDMLRAFYALVPDAKIRTALATYEGAAHFERSYRGTKQGNPTARMGLPMLPYQDACTCEREWE